MKDRIKKIMEQQGMNQKDFSLVTGINQATLSGIFNGRTGATLAHADSLHRTFPNLSMKWLMFGEGPMYEEGGDGIAPEFDFDHAASSSTDQDCLTTSSSNQLQSQSSAAVLPATHVEHEQVFAPRAEVEQVVKYVDKPQRKIIEIRIYFDDGTYQTFSGK